MQKQFHAPARLGTSTRVRHRRTEALKAGAMSLYCFNLAEQ